MSSSEIAELTGKQHKHVIRDIREMLAELEKDGPVLGHVREDKDSRGYTENFHLDRELTETLVTGYSIPLRHKVIRRLHELEEKVAKPAFDLAALSDPRTLLALLTQNVTKVVTLEADNSELSHENLMLEQKVAADAPKVGFFDAVTVTHETYSVAEAAKLIGTGQNRLMAFLRQRRWVTIRKNEPMQGPIESGYLASKLSTFEHPENGKTTVVTPRVTGKGLTKLQAMWSRREADLLGGAQ
ncbi:phage antirepressor KilAC domain-containing protein [Pseudomonas frederiksbergensis]|nr:phage regulatory protein/antirepressor Ant [Pseudomonas frederiksbergensis]